MVISFFSIDDCDNTGDHENYFKDVTEAYEIDGTKYTDCKKKAVTYRSKNEHKPLSRLTDKSILLSDGLRFSPLSHTELFNRKEYIDPKYS